MRLLLAILALVLVAYALRRRDVTARPDWHRIPMRPMTSNGPPVDPYVNSVAWGSW